MQDIERAAVCAVLVAVAAVKGAVLDSDLNGVALHRAAGAALRVAIIEMAVFDPCGRVHGIA